MADQLGDRLANIARLAAERMTYPAPLALVDPMAAEAEQGRDEWRRNRWSTLVPSRFCMATLEDIDGDARDTLGEWAARPGARNLVLAGPVGAGKTHAAVAAAREVFTLHRFDVTFLPVVELLDQLRPGGPADALAELCEVDLLVVDDLGSERPTDWTAERMFAVVNRRWLDERPTVVTTNLTGRELEQAVGARTYSRVVGGAVTVTIRGEDRRKGTR